MVRYGGYINMWYVVVTYLLLAGRALAEQMESRLTHTTQGPLRGYKDPIEDIFVFYNVPYAEVPTGSEKFKAPLPARKWIETFEAIDRGITCPQYNPIGFLPPSKTIQEDCLVANIYVPNTNESNISVLVNVHGGAFVFGYGDLFTPKKLVSSKKIIAITFNYRLGAHGFLCLGTKDVPGNAGMKDQVALLRWVRDNIENFGGNPHDVTISGYSAGATSVGLLMISPMAKGLFNKVILESGSILSPYSVQINPINNARTYAKLISLNETGDINCLESYFKNASYEILNAGDVVTRTDSNFVVTPCVERDMGQEIFLDDSPLHILKKGDFEKLPILVGFTNMEGLFRIYLFDQWKNKMNDNFEEFLPPDLHFEDDKSRNNVIDKIKEFYFHNKPVSNDSYSVLSYINYFSDTMFTCPTLRSIKLMLDAGNELIYLYKYSYENDDTSTVSYIKEKGADHCAQTRVIFDDININGTSIETNELQNWRDQMREIWLSFMTNGKPQNSKIPEWIPVRKDQMSYMVLEQDSVIKNNPLKERCLFWEQIYDKYYSQPIPPPIS